MSMQPRVVLAVIVGTAGVPLVHLGLNTRALDFARGKALASAEFRVGFLPVT